MYGLPVHEDEQIVRVTAESKASKHEMTHCAMADGYRVSRRPHVDIFRISRNIRH